MLVVQRCGAIPQVDSSENAVETIHRSLPSQSGGGSSGMGERAAALFHGSCGRQDSQALQIIETHDSGGIIRVKTTTVLRPYRRL